MSGNFSHLSTVFEEMYNCFNSTAGAISITVFCIIDITMILPLCIIVLYLGFQRWQQQTPNTPMSHSDVLTYNMILLDLLQIIGSVISCYSIHADDSFLLAAGVYMLSLYLSGQMMLFPLTCVDYYLAIIFPIVYLSLKKPKFIRARNILIGCIWACTFAEIVFLRFLVEVKTISLLSFVSSFLLSFVIFSCFSVLHALIRPGPGEGGRRQVNQAKLKAFNTIIAVLTVLTFRLLGVTVCNNFYSVQVVNKSCAVLLFIIGGGLPCSLLQLILFLQRTGKLPFIKPSN